MHGGREVGVLRGMTRCPREICFAFAGRERRLGGALEGKRTGCQAPVGSPPKPTSPQGDAMEGVLL